MVGDWGHLMNKFYRNYSSSKHFKPKYDTKKKKNIKPEMIEA